MSLREFSTVLGRVVARDARASARPVCLNARRHASSQAAPKNEAPADFQDLESQSSMNSKGPSEDIIKSYNPVKRAAARKTELPPSRYQYRSPRYYRGPLHPHQPPPASDPASRLYVPGPFNLPRLTQTYKSTIASDLMTLTYAHSPPGHQPAPKAPRLREWDDSSPYHKNRPKRGPRGGDNLRLIEETVNWNNIPRVEGITVHTMVKGAISDSAYLHVAGILLQSITGVRPVVHKSRKNVAAFGIREHKPIALTCHMRNEQAMEFLDKCIHLVLPKIKDWPGVQGSSGDSSGNISFGFDKESVTMFPEVEVNYDMYPPKMIPGFHVTIHTTASSDRHARLLLQSLGLPFYGKVVN